MVKFAIINIFEYKKKLVSKTPSPRKATPQEPIVTSTRQRASKRHIGQKPAKPTSPRGDVNIKCGDKYYIFIQIWCTRANCNMCVRCVSWSCILVIFRGIIPVISDKLAAPEWRSSSRRWLLDVWPATKPFMDAYWLVWVGVEWFKLLNFWK